MEFEKTFETKYDVCVDKALEYGVDLRVMLTTNLCPTKGLANGVQGVIKDIIPEPTLGPPNCPRAIIIQIPDWKGESFHPTEPGYIALPPKVVNFLYNDYNVSRLGFVCRLAEGISVYRAQG